MKQVLFVVLLVVGILLLAPAGMVDLVSGGTITPLKTFLIPTVVRAWRSITARRGISSLPIVFSFPLRFILTLFAVVSFWLVLVWKSVFFFLGFFVRGDALGVQPQDIPLSTDLDNLTEGEKQSVYEAHKAKRHTIFALAEDDILTQHVGRLPQIWKPLPGKLRKPRPGGVYLGSSEGNLLAAMSGAKRPEESAEDAPSSDEGAEE